MGLAELAVEALEQPGGADDVGAPGALLVSIQPVRACLPGEAVVHVGRRGRARRNLTGHDEILPAS